MMIPSNRHVWVPLGNYITKPRSHDNSTSIISHIISPRNHHSWWKSLSLRLPCLTRGTWGFWQLPVATNNSRSSLHWRPRFFFLGWLEVLPHIYIYNKYIYIYIDLIVRIKAGASKKVDPPSQQCFPIKLKDCNPSITRDCPKVGKFRNTDGPFLNQWIWGFPPISSDHSHFHNNPH